MCSILIARFAASVISISANPLLQVQETKFCKAREHKKSRESPKTNISDIIRPLCGSGQCHRRRSVPVKGFGSKQRRQGELTHRSHALSAPQKPHSLASHAGKMLPSQATCWPEKLGQNPKRHIAGFLLSHHIFLTLLFYSSPSRYLFFLWPGLCVSIHPNRQLCQPCIFSSISLDLSSLPLL